MCLATTTPEATAGALLWLLAPLRPLGLAVDSAVLTLLLSLRFMGIVFDEVSGGGGADLITPREEGLRTAGRGRGAGHQWSCHGVGYTVVGERGAALERFTGLGSSATALFGHRLGSDQRGGCTPQMGGCCKGGHLADLVRSVWCSKVGGEFSHVL